MQTSAKAADGQQRRIRILHLFQERVKELAATMLQDDAQDIAALMREVVAMLPSAWQYPAETSARPLWRRIHSWAPAPSCSGPAHVCV